MSKQESQKYIVIQLSRLNEIIDKKIIRGESYRKEAVRHKELSYKLRRLQRDSSWSAFFSRLIHS